MSAIVCMTTDEGVAASLRGILPNPDKLLICRTLEEACHRLQDYTRAVVFFQADTSGETASTLATTLATTMERLRQALASTTGIAVVDGRNVPPDTHFQADCQLLDKSLKPFEVLSRLSSAQRQSDLLATLKDCGQMDPDTGLYTRRYFLQRLGEEMSLARRHLSPVACVIIGVNLYQMYLDSYGYDFTITLFRHLGAQINTLVRHEDLIARVSDDEIGILLPRSTEKGAKVFANRIILTLDESTFAFNGHEEELSLCAGIASYPLDDGDTGADADTIMRYTRHALHQARCSEDEFIRVQLFGDIRPTL